MFVERKPETAGPATRWLEGLARRHPSAFVALLVLLAAGVTLGMLLRSVASFVLYQGF